jgi:hypothetical protein
MHNLPRVILWVRCWASRLRHLRLPQTRSLTVLPAIGLSALHTGTQTLLDQEKQGEGYEVK